jgi:MoxR-like ATPase
VPHQVIDPDTLLAAQAAADGVFVHHAVAEYAVRLVMATRDPAAWQLPELVPLIANGASPRGSLGLVRAARALALLRGRDYVMPQDVADLAVDVLAHRLVLSFDALADGVPQKAVVERVLAKVGQPMVAPAQPGSLTA